jgi:hypothetical protein
MAELLSQVRLMQSINRVMYMLEVVVGLSWKHFLSLTIFVFSYAAVTITFLSINMLPIIAAMVLYTSTQIADVFSSKVLSEAAVFVISGYQRDKYGRKLEFGSSSAEAVADINIVIVRLYFLSMCILVAYSCIVGMVISLGPWLGAAISVAIVVFDMVIFLYAGSFAKSPEKDDDVQPRTLLAIMLFNRFVLACSSSEFFTGVSILFLIYSLVLAIRAAYQLAGVKMQGLVGNHLSIADLMAEDMLEEDEGRRRADTLGRPVLPKAPTGSPRHHSAIGGELGAFGQQLGGALLSTGTKIMDSALSFVIDQATTIFNSCSRILFLLLLVYVGVVVYFSQDATLGETEVYGYMVKKIYFGYINFCITACSYTGCYAFALYTKNQGKVTLGTFGAALLAYALCGLVAGIVYVAMKSSVVVNCIMFVPCLVTMLVLTVSEWERINYQLLDPPEKRSPPLASFCDAFWGCGLSRPSYMTMIYGLLSFLLIAAFAGVILSDGYWWGWAIFYLGTSFMFLFAGFMHWRHAYKISRFILGTLFLSVCFLWALCAHLWMFYLKGEASSNYALALVCAATFYPSVLLVFCASFKYMEDGESSRFVTVCGSLAGVITAAFIILCGVKFNGALALAFMAVVTLVLYMFLMRKAFLANNYTLPLGWLVGTTILLCLVTVLGVFAAIYFKTEFVIFIGVTLFFFGASMVLALFGFATDWRYIHFSPQILPVHLYLPDSNTVVVHHGPTFCLAGSIGCIFAWGIATVFLLKPYCIGVAINALLTVFVFGATAQLQRSAALDLTKALALMGSEGPKKRDLMLLTCVLSTLKGLEMDMGHLIDSYLKSPPAAEGGAAVAAGEDGAEATAVVDVEDEDVPVEEDGLTFQGHYEYYTAYTAVELELKAHAAITDRVVEYIARSQAAASKDREKDPQLAPPAEPEEVAVAYEDQFDENAEAELRARLECFQNVSTGISKLRIRGRKRFVLLLQQLRGSFHRRELRKWSIRREKNGQAQAQAGAEEQKDSDVAVVTDQGPGRVYYFNNWSGECQFKEPKCLALQREFLHTLDQLAHMDDIVDALGTFRYALTAMCQSLIRIAGLACSNKLVAEFKEFLRVNELGHFAKGPMMMTDAAKALLKSKINVWQEEQRARMLAQSAELQEEMHSAALRKKEIEEREQADAERERQEAAAAAAEAAAAASASASTSKGGGGGGGGRTELPPLVLKVSYSEAEARRVLAKAEAEFELTGKLFEDELFKADRSSCGPRAPMVNDGTEWSRPPFLLPKDDEEIKYQAVLFDENDERGVVDPNDVVQGALGDCYYLSALIAMASKGTKIPDLFLNKKISRAGCYAVKFWRKGEWRYVIVDDRQALLGNRNPMFAWGRRHVIWPALLEKAYAKYYSSYSSIVAGQIADALMDISGPHAATEQITLTDAVKTNPDTLWSKLIKYTEAGYLMGAQTPPSPYEKTLPSGIIHGHAYGIITCKMITDNEGKEVRMVHIRNPHGCGEWKGAWADGSTEWTPRTMKQVNYHEDAKDGMFWMNFEDVLIQFRTLFVCRLFDHPWVKFEAKNCAWSKANNTCGGFPQNGNPAVKNPQWSVKVTEKTDIFVRMSQEEAFEIQRKQSTMTPEQKAELAPEDIKKPVQMAFFITKEEGKRCKVRCEYILFCCLNSYYYSIGARGGGEGRAWSCLVFFYVFCFVHLHPGHGPTV